MLIIRGRLRRRAIGLTGLAAICAVGWATFLKPTAVERRESTERQMDRVLPELNFAAVPADQAIRFIGEVAHVHLQIDWDALKVAGVERNTPITMRLRNCKASRALNVLLKEARNDPDTQPCFYHILDDGQIHITTPQASKSHLIERRYDLRPLITTAPGNYSDRELADAVVKLIEDTVASDTWKNNGGEPGTIWVDSGWMVVRQTHENQRSVERLMEQLWETRVTASLVSVERTFLSR